jgi:hypothetical protein
MPESAEQLYARVVEQVGAGGRLPMPPYQEWDIFPWEVVDGALVPKVLQPPVEAEEPRAGEGPTGRCVICAEDVDAPWIWENERWFLSRPAQPGGMPLLLWLQTKEHMDYPDMGDELAAEYGRLSVWLCRIIEALPHIGRAHVCRWGDGGEHLHVWFIGRPARIPGLLGSMAVEWNEMLPPPPEDVWHQDLADVARRLATHEGRALV